MVKNHNCHNIYLIDVKNYNLITPLSNFKHLDSKLQYTNGQKKDL
jgi:hypothetical protein